MKSTLTKRRKAQKAAAKKGPLSTSKTDENVIVLGGVSVTVPRPPGKPRFHTEREIREMFRDFYAARKA
jgi:hypothetical protein